MSSIFNDQKRYNSSGQWYSKVEENLEVVKKYLSLTTSWWVLAWGWYFQDIEEEFKKF